MGEGFDAWKKGGLRQATLKRTVPSFLTPARVDAFFLATKKRRSFPVSSLNPFVVLRTEFVVAATEEKLVVLRLKRPAIIRAAIDGPVSEVSLSEPTIDWNGESLEIVGERFFPIPFHWEDAEEVALRCSAGASRR